MILAGFLTRVLFSRGTMKGKGTQRVMAVSGIALRESQLVLQWWEQGRCLYPGKMQRNAPPLHYPLALLSFSTNSTASWLWGIWKWILLQWKASDGLSWDSNAAIPWPQPLLGPSILRVTAALIWLPGKKDWVCGLKEVREFQPLPWPGWAGHGIRAVACTVEPVCLQSRHSME